MIFVDTGAFIGWFCPDDQHHAAAFEKWAELVNEPQKLVTSNFVLDETITLLSRKTSNRYAAARAEDILSSSYLHLVQSTEAHQLAALELFKRYADQKMSYTDCVSFAIMQELEIQTAFSFDHHFRIAGFQTLP